MSDPGGVRFPESGTLSGERQDLSRRESSMKAAILKALAEGPMTVPEIAEALSVTPREAMWWVMGCWRYGLVTPAERADENGYYKYSIADRDE